MLTVWPPTFLWCRWSLEQTICFGSKAAACRLLFASLGPQSAIDFAFTGGEGAVSEPGSAIGGEDPGPPLVFISYATADRAEALKVCKAIERRGTQCWISTRDVPPGANYQEAIVQSLRTARAVVLVFSDAANTSGEIKKELSLASRYHVPVIALRLKDVEPSDAFAYELSTRQWINAFEGWDKSIDTLVGRIGQISGSGPVAPTAATPASRRTAFSSGRGMAIAAAGLLSLVAAAGAWWASFPNRDPVGDDAGISGAIALLGIGACAEHWPISASRRWPRNSAF
ncbi:MAG: toll/interleukin-1 receptor domain-containing protein [Gammaproteobacteria bacterium]